MDPEKTSLDSIEMTASEWIARRESGRWGASDAAELERWLQSATAHRIAYLRLLEAWERMPVLRDLAAQGAAGHEPVGSASKSERASATVSWQSSRVIHPRYRWYSAAAVLLLASIAASVFYFEYSASKSYETAIGKVANLSLADGTTVVLDSNSRFVVRMRGKERHVELERGAAFFNIAKDAARPFVVGIGNKRVTDIGTQFTVRRNSDSLAVLVTAGKVQVVSSAWPSSRPQAELEAGSEALVTDSSIKVNILSASRLEELSSWQTGHLIFHDTTLPDAIAEFNRYSARPIVIEGPSLADVRIGGNFRTSDVDGFLSLVKRGFPVQVSEDSSHIVLRRR